MLILVPIFPFYDVVRSPDRFFAQPFFELFVR